MTYDGYSTSGEKVDTGAALFSRTMILTSVMCGISAFGSYLTWGWTMHWSLILILALGAIGCCLWAGAMMKRNDLAACLPGMTVPFLMGMVVGPAFQMYVEVLGPELFSYIMLGAAGIGAACGAIAALVSIPYRKMEGFLVFALLAMIVVGIVFLFTGLPPVQVDITYCVIGIVIFIGFFLVDFARLYDAGKRGESAWGMATFMALGLYLDLLNLILYALRLAWDLKK